MSLVRSPIALAALNRALKSVRNGPPPRPKFDSRYADKFVIRGFVELFEELGGIGRHEGRSMNSEAVAAILDMLEGQVRSVAMLNILKEKIGNDMSQRVLAELPDFDLSSCKVTKKFVVRFPPNVRGSVHEDVRQATSGSSSMNHWVLKALVAWVNIKRQHYALLSAAIAIDEARRGAPARKLNVT